MRGLSLAAVCLALAAAAAVLPAANPPAGARTFGPHAAETANAAVEGACLAWKQHRKRVVRYVWRGGERRRVVRLKRWRTCKRRSAPAPAPAPPPPAAPEPPPVETPPPEDPTLPRLSVKAAEWSYTLSRPEVAAGEVLVDRPVEGDVVADSAEASPAGMTSSQVYRAFFGVDGMLDPKRSSTFRGLDER